MRLLLISFILLYSNLLQSQSFKISSLVSNKKGIIKGVVFDSETENNPLVFAEVRIKNSNIATTTNSKGNYSLLLKPGNYTLIYSFIGYQTIEVKNIVVSSKNLTTCNKTLFALKLESDFSVSATN